MKRWVLMGSMVVAAVLTWWLVDSRGEPPAGEAAGPLAHADAGTAEDENASRSDPAPDGHGGPVRLVAPLRIERLDEIHPPAGPLTAIHDELVERAAGGDAVAAYELYRALRYCRSAAASAEDLEARIQHLQATRRMGSIPVDDPTPIVAEYRERFAYCEGVTDEMEDEFYGWLRYSAELGLLQAMIQMGAEAHPESWDVDVDDPANAQRVAELRADWVGWQQRAAAAGSVEAMRALSHSYRRGVVIERDLELAYAFALAAATVREAAGIVYPPERRNLELIAEALQPWQLEQARHRAEEILADPRCCKL